VVDRPCASVLMGSSIAHATALTLAKTEALRHGEPICERGG
jgi:hypothetical protein